VLFDEIEEASDALWQLPLGILDKGMLTLGGNRRVDFSCSVIFLTSNLGSQKMSQVMSGDMDSPPGLGSVMMTPTARSIERQRKLPGANSRLSLGTVSIR